MAIISAVDLQRWERIAKFAIEEAKIRNEKIYFLHCVEVPKVGSMVAEKVLEEEGEKMGMEMLSKCAEIAKREGVEFETVLSKDKSVAKFIIEFADKINASLIIIGTTKKTKAGKILFGSVARDVILNSKQPVVCLK
uniref:Universal stress protein n=1 Tax=Archaeoglobus fulgidus TaxID=2234 RepID=A0A7J2TI54_ARCFL